MRPPFTLLVHLTCALAGPALAQGPSPIDGQLFAFPGSLDQPASAGSAGLGLADRWLGDEPFLNPATPGGRRVVVSPTLFRVSRQDLRAANRNYDDQPLFFDFAGGAATIPGVPVWVYGYQPVMRTEDYAFSRGTGADPEVPPAILQGQGEMREVRAGVSSSVGLGPWRAGAAVEWTHRQDDFATQEQSGGPDQGRREVSYDGDAVGGAIGLRYDSADSGAGRLTIGASLRYLPALEVTGEQLLDLVSGTSLTDVRAEREAGWEGGLSARYFMTPAFALLAAGGGRTEQSWDGFDLTSGATATWRVAMQFHDSRDPWTFRLAMGQDQQDGVPEPRAGVFGFGMGWDFDDILVDVGVLHRGIERTGAPTSYEDRLVGSVTVGF